MRINGRAALTRIVSGIVVSTALSGLLSAQSGKNSSTAKAAKSPDPQLKRLSDGQPDIEGVWTTVFYGMGCLTNPTHGDVNCVPPPGPRPAAGTANAGGPPPPDANGVTSGQRERNARASGVISGALVSAGTAKQIVLGIGSAGPSSSGDASNRRTVWSRSRRLAPAGVNVTPRP